MRSRKLDTVPCVAAATRPTQNTKSTMRTGNNIEEKKKNKSYKPKADEECQLF